MCIKTMSATDSKLKNSNRSYKDYDVSKHSSPHPNDTQLGTAEPINSKSELSRREQAFLHFEEKRLLQEKLEENFIFCDVAGISYRSRSEIKRANELCKGEYLYLEEEPDNVYDKNAIKVITNDDFFIGNIPAFLCTDVKQLMEAHPDYDVVVTNIGYGSSAPFVDICIKYNE